MLQGPGTSKEPARVGSSAGLRTLSADLETGCLFSFHQSFWSCAVLWQLSGAQLFQYRWGN